MTFLSQTKLCIFIHHLICFCFTFFSDYMQFSKNKYDPLHPLGQENLQRRYSLKIKQNTMVQQPRSIRQGISVSRISHLIHVAMAVTP